MLIGPVIAGVIGWFAFDEEDCLWWWISAEFFNNVYLNAWYIDYMLSQGMWTEVAILVDTLFYGSGYFRLGHITYRDPKNIGNPHEPYYAVSATSSSTGNGHVNNLNNILGTPDGSYAYLNSGSFGNKAEITATLTSSLDPVSGILHLRCYTPSGNGSNLKVYVRNYNGVWNPDPVVNTNLYPPSSVMDVNCGYVSGIVEVSIVAYHQYSGYPSYIYADAVWVA